MATTAPFSKKQLRKAGDLLRCLATPGTETPPTSDLIAAMGIVEWWRAQHARPLVRVNAGLRHYVRKAGVEPEVTQRLKRFSTIIHKLARHPNMSLSTMEDIGGVRAILQYQSQVDEVVRHLQRRWKIRRVREYISGRVPGPKEDGYRCVHVVVEKDGCFVEVQLRTPWQDSWAQSVEQDTRRLGAGLKFGVGPDDLRDYYRVTAEYLELRELGREAPQELLVELTNLHSATRRYYSNIPRR